MGRGTTNESEPVSAMAGASADVTAGELAADAEPSPIPVHVLRRERWFLALLASAIVVSGLIGWMTVPTNETLLSRATNHADVGTRIEAMNSLVLRGYWHNLPPGELEAFLATAPVEMRQFIADAHGGLLKR